MTYHAIFTSTGTATAVKWDLDNWQAIDGHASQRVRDLIQELEREGLL